MHGKRRPIPKVPTQITGLDQILEGGLPRKRTTLVCGGPGSGKTVMGLEFLCRGAIAGEAGVFVTFEERTEAVRMNARSMGWNLAAMEKAGRIVIVEARMPGQEVRSGDFDIDGILAIVGGHAKKIGAKRIVLDALDVLLRVYDDVKRERSELERLHDWLADRGLTTVLTVKTHLNDANFQTHYEFLDFMADCVIRLDHRVVGQVATRRLRVIKYRGSGFGTNEYPYVFGEHGIVLFPLTTTELTHQPLGPKISSGLKGLDRMLDGGFRRTSCILISGNSGAGKTTLASTFALAACRRGEKVLSLNFEESKEALISGMLSAGIDLRRSIRSKKLLIQTAMPESTGSDGHLIRTIEALDKFKPNHLILDAVSACLRMGSEQAAFDFMMRLVSNVKERGITSILTNQVNSETGGDEELSGIGFSSVVDAVVQLRFVETENEVNRQIFIVKSRGSAHSNRRQRYVITDRGVEFPDEPQPPSAIARKLSRKGGRK
ncbi:MAG: circadian clock protein KaiC [Planctomycetes bacterium]|nr:circadian clock protein KaiC [Planctomycetota bacterium]